MEAGIPVKFTVTNCAAIVTLVKSFHHASALVSSLTKLRTGDKMTSKVLSNSIIIFYKIIQKQTKITTK